MVILSIDAGLLGKKKSYIDFPLDLVKYVRNGGTLILACLFSGNASRCHFSEIWITLQVWRPPLF